VERTRRDTRGAQRCRGERADLAASHGLASAAAAGSPVGASNFTRCLCSDPRPESRNLPGIIVVWGGSVMALLSILRAMWSNQRKWRIGKLSARARSWLPGRPCYWRR